MSRRGWFAALALIAALALMPSRAAPDADVPPPSDDEEVLFLDEELTMPAAFLPSLGPRQISNFIAIAQVVLAALMAIRSWSPLGQIAGAALVYADTWLLLGGMPGRAHTEHCRSLTALVVAAAVALALGARVAAGLSIAVGSLFPQNWLLWPKRQRETGGSDGQQARPRLSADTGAASRVARTSCYGVTVAMLRQHGCDTARSVTHTLEEELGMPPPVKLTVQYPARVACLFAVNVKKTVSPNAENII